MKTHEASSKKTYETLVSDIQELLNKGVDDIYDDFLDDFTLRIRDTLKEKLRPRKSRNTLRMSNMGQGGRKLWYTVNEPEYAEPLSPENLLKFLYGDLIEEFLLFLVELAGHTVTGRQTELEIAGIKGHRDVIIDGMLMDCKSASSFSFIKFKEHKLLDDDPFGYVDQIMSYLDASQNDPLLKIKDKAGFLVLDKQHGHVCLDIYERQNIDFEKYYEYKKNLVAQKEPPARCFEPVPMGVSGNMKLVTNCSYCEFKKRCHPELRTFIYSTGPVYLTEVKKEPNVYEIKSDT